MRHVGRGQPDSDARAAHLSWAAKLIRKGVRRGCASEDAVVCCLDRLFDQCCFARFRRGNSVSVRLDRVSCQNGANKLLIFCEFVLRAPVLVPLMKGKCLVSIASAYALVTASPMIMWGTEPCAFFCIHLKRSRRNAV